MDWVQWLIPLVAVAVYIVSNLIKNQQEDARRPMQRTPPRLPGEEPISRPPRSPEEIDRFLEEVRRKQRAAEQRERVPRSVPPPLPAEKARSIPAPRKRDQSRKPAASPVEAEPIMVAEVVEQAQVQPPPPPLRSPARKGSPGLLNLSGFLKNRQNLAAAILLKEILEPPLCKRRKRG